MTDKKTIEKAKLIKLLSSFSALEWKRFGRLVQSPYFNTNQQVIDLYTHLKKAFPFDDLKLLEQERIFKKIYKKNTFKLNQFQKLCSELYQLACDFVIDVHLQKEKRKRDKVLIDALSERNYELFKGNSQQLIKEVESQEYFLDEDDFLLLHQLNKGLHHHIETDAYKVHQIELEKTLENLDAFYQAMKFQIETENRGIQNILNEKRELEDTDRNQLNHLFQEATNLYNTKKTDLYFQLKEKVFDNWHQLKAKHKTNLLVHLLNFSFTNELIQKEFGHKEALDLYKIGIENKLFIINGKMRDIEFINISMIGFKYESEEWTTRFIDTHKRFLSSDIRQFLVPLSHAYNAIFKNDFEQVIFLLKGVNPNNNLLYLDKIKALLVRAYFEAIINGFDEYRQPFIYEIEAMKKSITRNKKLSSIKLEARNNFLLLMKKLLILYDEETNELEKINSFQELIQNTTPLLLRQWLTEKFMQRKNAALYKDSIRD